MARITGLSAKLMVKRLQEAFAFKGYSFFTSGDYNLNIENSLRQVRPEKLESEQSIFDWMGVIENAKEVHGISSSFTHLIDSMELKNKLYFHDIKAAHGMGFSLKNNWEIISYG